MEYNHWSSDFFYNSLMSIQILVWLLPNPNAVSAGKLKILLLLIYLLCCIYCMPTSVVWFLQEFDSFFLCKSSTHLFAAGVRLIFLCKSSTHFARAKIMQEFDSFLCLQEFNSFCSSENHARVRLIFMLARVQLILLERKSCKSSTHFEACKS